MIPRVAYQSVKRNHSKVITWYLKLNRTQESVSSEHVLCKESLHALQLAHFLHPDLCLFENGLNKIEKTSTLKHEQVELKTKGQAVTLKHLE